MLEQPMKVGGVHALQERIRAIPPAVPTDRRRSLLPQLTGRQAVGIWMTWVAVAAVCLIAWAVAVGAVWLLIRFV